MAIYTLDGKALQHDQTVWIAESAQIIGEVYLGTNASVWFNAVLRADNEPMRIGAGTNIQDGAVLHSDPGFALSIGASVTVGHKAMLHGCTIGDESLIGISAIVLNGARIGCHCLVGAGALVTEGKTFPDGSLIVGSPAVVRRNLTPAQIHAIKTSAQHYIENARRYRKGLTKG